MQPSPENLREKVVQTILDAEDLPGLPETVVRVMRLTASEDASTEAVAQVILQLPSLTAKILRYVNSPLCGFCQEITSIHQAVVLAGFAAIRDLVTGLAIIDLYDASRLKNFPVRRFTDLAFQSAVAGHLVAEITGQSAEEVFIAGLLHDIGTLLLGRYHPEVLARVLEAKKLVTDNITVVERRIMGLDHTLVGALLGARWRLPRVFIDVIRNHHEQHFDAIEDPSSRRVVQTVILADQIVRLFHRQRPEDMRRVNALWDRFLGLPVEQAEGLLARFPERVTNFSVTFETRISDVDTFEEVLENMAA